MVALQIGQPMLTRFLICLGLCFSSFGNGRIQAQPNNPPKLRLDLPGETLTISGKEAFLFLPSQDKRTSPQPWIFYAPTLRPYPDQAERWMHERFLDAGIAVAGIDVGEAYGAPSSHASFSALYDELEKRGFSKKPCLLGRSRGGLWVTSWAIANPQRVSGILGIYPVFDLRTYPKLAKAAPAYGISESDLEKQLGEWNPISKVGLLAENGIQVAIIHGDDDKVVPLKENSQELLRRYEEKGRGSLVHLIVAPGQGHNYWEGFFRNEALVDFAIARAKAGARE